MMNLKEIAALKKEILSSLHCALPGIVESFDPVSGTATVRPALRRVCHPDRSGGISRVIPSAVEGSLEYPLLRDVPVFMPVPFEVSPGDRCLLVFADCDIDAWSERGEVSEPASGRMHDLADAFAFVGFTARGR